MSLDTGYLNLLLSKAGLTPVEAEVETKFNLYLDLIMRWNSRTNLTAVRNPEEIIGRHFVESIALGQNLDAEVASLLDFGSGAGFPGVPIALCRPEISVTLAESQGKKAAFLLETVRCLGIKATVWRGRAEELRRLFDCVTLRAVDCMEQAVGAASLLVRAGGWLSVMTTESQAQGLKVRVGDSFDWGSPVILYGTNERVILTGRRVAK
jgi:16S rRNA (guanine527-N7)-methyltransferase